jgi:hypothetical protein
MWGDGNGDDEFKSIFTPVGFCQRKIVRQMVEQWHSAL